MGKSSGKQTSTSEPWKQVVPYLLGTTTDANGNTVNKRPGGDLPGLFQLATDVYGRSAGLSPQEQEALNFMGQVVKNRFAGTDEISRGATDVMRGAFDTQIDRPRDIQTNAISAFTPTRVNGKGLNAERTTAPQVSLPGARQSQGVLDPTAALQQLQSGQVNNAVLDPQAQVITNNLIRNYTESILPQVRSQALALGQYGGTKGQIAEGLAASRFNQDVATAITPLYGQAFENAQNRMMGTAHALNEQGANNATMNADRAFSSDVGNANRALQAGGLQAQLDLQSQIYNNDALFREQAANIDNSFRNQATNNQNLLNFNQQAVGANQANLNNRVTGLNALGQAQNFGDLAFQQYMDLLGLPRNRDMEALQFYSNILQGGAQLGGTNTQRASGGRNPIAGALGGGMAGATLGPILSSSTAAGPIGIAAGATLGLLSSLF